MDLYTRIDLKHRARGLKKVQSVSYFEYICDDTDSWAAEICWFKWNRYKKQGRRRSFVEMPCKMLMRTTVKLESIIKQQIN